MSYRIKQNNNTKIKYYKYIYFLCQTESSKTGHAPLVNNNTSISSLASNSNATCSAVEPCYAKKQQQQQQYQNNKC